MDKFADCTKRDEQSSTKLYNQEYVHGTRDAEMHLLFLFTRILKPIFFCAAVIQFIQSAF